MQTLATTYREDTDGPIGSQYEAAPLGLDFPTLPVPIAVMDREELFRDFAPLVRRLILHYGGSPELREELVGEIYCRFCALYDAFDPMRGIPLKPYMVRQLSASVYTFVRSYRRCAGREMPFEAGIDEVHQDLRVDPTSSWDEHLMLESIVNVLPAALGQLPERQQKVVLWRYYHGWAFEEIALQLDIQTATARSLLRHGLNNLRRWFLVNHLQSE